MSINAKFLRRTLVSLAVAGSIGTAMAAEAGRILFAIGDVSIVDAAGHSRPAHYGDVLAAGETLSTGNGGMAQVSAADGSNLSLMSGSQLRFDSGAGSAGQSITLLSGEVNRLGGSSSMTIHTANATVANSGSAMVGYSAGSGTGFYAMAGSTTISDSQGNSAGYTGAQGGQVDGAGLHASGDLGGLGAGNNGLPAGAGGLTANPPGVQNQAGELSGGGGGGGGGGTPTTMTATNLGFTSSPSAGFADVNAVTGALAYQGMMVVTSGTVAESGQDPVGVRWGRYAPGATSEFRDPFITPYPTGVANDISWVSGALPTNMPTTGTVNYTQVGGTTPVDTNGVAGTLNSASLSVNFTSQQATATVSATISGTTLSASGGVMNLGTSGAGTFSMNPYSYYMGETPFNVSCSGTCGTASQVTLAGGVMGDGATAAGFSYQLVTGAATPQGWVDMSSTAATTPKSISGVVAFKR